jgi:hypothetical protein
VSVTRPVPLSLAAAGDALTCAAFLNPDWVPNALTNWLITELDAVIAANHDEDTTSRLSDLLQQARTWPRQQGIPPHVVMASTRRRDPFPMLLGDARAVLDGEGVSCWWRPHPPLPGYDLFVMRPAAGLADPEHAGLFFQVTAPACTASHAWAGEPR